MPHSKIPRRTSSRVEARRLELVLLTLLVAPLGCRGIRTEASEPASPARSLLERSLRYHDPEGVWDREPLPLRWTGLGPDGAVHYAYEMTLGPGGDFCMQGERGGRHVLEYRVVDGIVHARVDGRVEVARDVRAELLLDRDEGFFWRDYYGFLGGLPMCLARPSVLLDSEVEQAEFEGRAASVMRAHFAPGVGTDAWAFYFDPATAALMGCSFDRADPTRDGETIVFEGSAMIGSLRLPAIRRWYSNADRLYLGADELGAATSRSPPGK